MFEKLAIVLPRLRNQFGFLGLLVLVVGIIATRLAAPTVLPAQIAAGGAGVNILIFGQVFYFLRLIPAKDRARFILSLFVVFCVTTLALLGVAAYLATAHRLKISSVSLSGWSRSGETTMPNTVDDAQVLWSHAGTATDMMVSLIRVPDNHRVSLGPIDAADHRLVVPAAQLQRLWPRPQLSETYRVRVEFQSGNELLAFGPFDVRMALRLKYYLDDHTVTVAAVCCPDGGVLAHDFEARVVAEPMHASPSTPPAVHVVIHAHGGKGSAVFPSTFDPDPASLKCVYLGTYPQSLVRYENLHT